MSARESIARRVSRTYLIGLVLAATSIVGVSAIVGTGVVIVRDDADAIALGRVLVTELDDHEDEHDRVVRHELAEQHWFARRIEVWSGSDRIGGEEREGTLARFAERPSGSCELASVGPAYERVCVVHASSGEAVIVASELAPMLGSMLPMLASLALVALAVTLLFGILGRRAVGRSLEPLARFEAAIAAVPARAGSRGVTAAWGSTELDSLAATFNAMLSRIDAAAVREQRFVADAAHQPRTPLTRLRAQLELARAESAEGKPVDARLAASVRTAIELASTTEALLALARDAIGKTEPVELAEVVETCVARLGDEERARVRFVGTDGVSVIADGVEPLLVLAAGNLIDNALKYGTGPVDVTIGAEGDVVAVVVADVGPGIAEDDLARVAEPFVRGASSGAVRGAGLGLALVDHVARLHHGSLSLANQRPRGLCARLALQRWQAAA